MKLSLIYYHISYTNGMDYFCFVLRLDYSICHICWCESTYNTGLYVDIRILYISLYVIHVDVESTYDTGLHVDIQILLH